MKSFWQMRCPSLESTMLSPDAKSLAETEQNEIISYLPDFKGKKVLELGAGIGRFTGSLAQMADHVTAVDSVQAFIDENKKVNGKQTNINFKCADITQLDYSPNSFDMVFSNWLFSYMTDEQISKVFEKVLKWLSPGGCFFLRESCNHKSDNKEHSGNPVIYRTPIDYCEALLVTKLLDKGSVFSISTGKSLLTYIKNCSNPNQVCFLAKRVECLGPNDQARYMHGRYSLKTILMVERLFGYTWYSTGGEATNRELCTQLNLRPNQMVLDVGCGTGGNAFFMARNYKVNVHGIDLSSSMIHMAIERQTKMEAAVTKIVQFEINDILAADCEQDLYDVIYSRDAILHIPNKKDVFKKLYKWLKPGGTIFFTDYARGHAPATRDFTDLMNKRGYNVITEQSYIEMLQAAGFKEIWSEDRREEFISILTRTLKSFVSCREAFVEDSSEELYEEFRSLWVDKAQMTRNGQMTWLVFKATK